MNKLNLLILLFVLAGSTVFAQETTPPAEVQKEDPEVIKRRNESDQKIYQLALRYNDLVAARIKLLELIERNPNNARYPELLASLYYDSNLFGSAAIAALDLLELNDRSTVGLEIAAYSLEQLGALDRALPQFERLYLLTDDIFSLYKTAYLQYSLKRYEEALNSINMLVKNNKSTEQKLGFPKEDNTNQEVSVKAAALNLKGMVYMDQNSKAEATTAFEQALELDPEFILAKQNLADSKK
jgi:tetratricopeptide (TPR) repeat protein